MKKVFLSVFVIVTFAAYAVHQQLSSSSQSTTTVPNELISSAPSTTEISSNTQQITPSSAPPNPTSSGQYKDGTYVGNAADAYYGNIQVQATIRSGKLTNVQFLQYPNDRGRSIAINSQADPMLAQEAIQSQSANVDIVSGATDSSQAFIQSLQSALAKAK